MSDAQRLSPLSTRRMVCVGQENSRTDKELEKEIARLEKERLATLRQLNLEVKRFRVSSARGMSPNRRDASPNRPTSPQKTIDCVLRPKEHQDKQRTSRDHSPVPPRHENHPGLARSVSHGHESLSPCELPPIHNNGSKTPSRSPSPRSSIAGSPPKSPRTLSPRQGYYKAVSIDNSDISPNHSPHSSPEPRRRLLTKRNTPEEKKPSVCVKSTTVTIIHPEEPGESRRRSSSLFAAAEYIDSRRASTSSCEDLDYEIENRRMSAQPFDTAGKESFPRPVNTNISVSAPIPQIVISGDAMQTIPENPESGRSDSSKTGKEPPSSPSENEGKHASLSVPIRRSRSSSVPSLPPPSAYLKALAKKQSTFTTADADIDHFIPLQMRGRSSSICAPLFFHLKDSPRRDSLLRKYTARRGSYRRTSATIENIISDLSRGIYHGEFNPDERRKPITPEEWEKLKKCRYLRMPKREENKDNVLDIDEIFDHPQEDEEIKNIIQ